MVEFLDMPVYSHVSLLYSMLCTIYVVFQRDMWFACGRNRLREETRYMLFLSHDVDKKEEKRMRLGAHFLYTALAMPSSGR